MFENIRRIGVFMIAAQAVIHFAPGRQYEKYIKLISSVIILFLFVRPFTSIQGEVDEEWQTGMEQALHNYENETFWEPEAEGVDGMMINQLEKEIKSRLNNEISGDANCVKSVSLVFEEDISEEGIKGYVSQIKRVEIVMTKREKETVEPVLVEEIVIGEEKQKEDTQEVSQYQKIFANILGIEPERVEVTCVGGW